MNHRRGIFRMTLAIAAIAPALPMTFDAAADEGAPMQAVAVDQLEGLDVVDDRGEALGEVENVVRNGGATYLIVRHGGWFLGLHGKEVAFPIDDFTVRDDRIVLRGLTEDRIAQMPVHDFEGDVELGDDDRVDVMVGS